jgi:hypothetical protein
MIAEAREIRENQTYRSNALSYVVTSAESRDMHFKVINLLYIYIYTPVKMFNIMHLLFALG